MREVKASPRDPAPSRLSYRMQRLALTPMVRRLFVFGLPFASLVFVASLAVSDQARREAMGRWWTQLKTDVQQRDEFMVKMIAVDGASSETAAEIRAIMPDGFPVSSFDLDLVKMQAKVSRIDAVKRADLRIKSGGVLQIRVVERIPALVWRTTGDLVLLDAAGERVAAIARRGERSDLPLVTGAGADGAAQEALEVFEAAAPLRDRLRGLVRVGQRRWTVVLDGGQSILLPEADPVDALRQVIAVDEAQDLFARDVRLMDMRNPRRPTVRLTAMAAKSMRQVKLSELGAGAE